VKLSKAEKDSALSIMLDPLPTGVRSVILQDTAFCSALGITPKFAFPLNAETAVESGSLHEAQRKAIAGKKSATVDVRGRRRLRVKLSRRGHNVTIEVGKNRFGLSDSDVLAASKPARLKALKRVLAAKPLFASEAEHWRRVAEDHPLGDREFVELMTALHATPEGFRAEFAKPRNLDSGMLLPDEPDYYARLLAPVGDTKEPAAFMSGPLAVARAELARKHPAIALRRIAYSAVWRPLIPFDLFGTLRPSEISALLKAQDPFSLLCGFELCCVRAADLEFLELGTQFLNTLLLDAESSKRRCTFFAAFALVTTVNIRNAAKASAAPLFWVRLAAFTHAGVLTDALSAIPDAEGFLRWAAEHFTPTYIWNTVIDRREAPRWSPDWIDPEHLVAELVGRVQNAVNLLPEGERPASWVSAVDQALTRLQKSGKYLAAFFAGPFEDFLPNMGRFSSEIDAFVPIEEMAARASKLPSWNELFSVANASRPSDGFVASIRRIVSAPAYEPIADTNELSYLRLCADLGAGVRDEVIANAVFNRCLAIARQGGRTDGLTDIFEVMIHACAAYAAPEVFRKHVGDTAAHLAGVADTPADLTNLLAIFDVLGGRDEQLIPALAKAKAILLTKIGRAT